MMTSLAMRPTRIPRLSRFGWLMGLYAENHTRLARMFAPAGLAVGSYRSSIGDGLDLQLDVIEQHRYTTELRLTYAMRDPRDRRARSVGLPAPVPRRPPARSHPLLRRAALAGRDRHVPAAGRSARPPHADEHVSRQVARVSSGAGTWLWQHCAPSTPAKPLADTTKKIWQRTLDDIAERPLEFSSFQHTWGHSSAGRAPAWHAGGRRFDPAWLHHLSPGCVLKSFKPSFVPIV